MPVQMEHSPYSGNSGFAAVCPQLLLCWGVRYLNSSHPKLQQHLGDRRDRSVINPSSSRCGAAVFWGCDRGTPRPISTDCLGAPGRPRQALHRWGEALAGDSRPAGKEVIDWTITVKCWHYCCRSSLGGILGSCRSCPRQLLLCLAWSECLNVLFNKLGGECSLALQRLPVLVSAVEGIKLCTILGK